MTPEKPDQPAPWKGLLGAIALSWLPVVLFLSLAANKATEPKAFGFAAAGAMLVVVVYVTSRKHAWSAILWVPLMLFAGIGGLALLGTGFSTPTSGPSAGPLEGVAVLIMLLLVVGFGVIVLLGGTLRPKSWAPMMLVIGLLNAALIAVASSRGSRAVTGDAIIIELRDPSGKAVTEASLKYLRYGYGSGGAEVFDESGGPIFSDEAGVVQVPSRRMRYKTVMTISKRGFRDVSLTVGMQFSKSDKTRTVLLSTVENRASAWGSVETSEPVRLKLYLSPVADAPSPEARHFSLHSKQDVPSDVVPKSLDLTTGKFRTDLSGDLGLDYFSATGTRFSDQRLRIRGLNGAQVILVENGDSRMISDLSYEETYGFAPQEGYQNEVLIERPGNSGGPAVYIRAADGRTHGRLHLEALGDGMDETPRYFGTLVINPSGRNF